MNEMKFENIGGSAQHTLYTLEDWSVPNGETVLAIEVHNPSGGWWISTHADVMNPEHMEALRTFLSEQLDRNEQMKPIEKRVGDFLTKNGATDIAFNDNVVYFRNPSGKMDGGSVEQLDKAASFEAYEKELKALKKRYGVV